MSQQQQHSGSKPHAANGSPAMFGCVRPCSEMQFRTDRRNDARGSHEAFDTACNVGTGRSEWQTFHWGCGAHDRRSITAALLDADVCASASHSTIVDRVVKGQHFVRLHFNAATTPCPPRCNLLDTSRSSRNETLRIKAPISHPSPLRPLAP